MAEVNLFSLASQPAKAQYQIIQKTLESFSYDVKSSLDEKDLLNQSQSFRLLSPLRHGPFGFDTLNQLIWNAVSKCLHSDWIAIPIIIISNDHKEELFNGDTGILIRKLPLQPVSSDDYALFQGRNGQRSIRKLPAALLPRYEYAYCLSVHKSQGSEFDHVSLVLPQGASHMGREVLYTAVTRARKQIDIHTTDEILLETIENQALRQSGISTRINA
jgi:exodeoxyribonuclease V alpha subunit